LIDRLQLVRLHWRFRVAIPRDFNYPLSPIQGQKPNPSPKPNLSGCSSWNWSKLGMATR